LVPQPVTQPSAGGRICDITPLRLSMPTISFTRAKPPSANTII
jgi:hypothetical protein